MSGYLIHGDARTWSDDGRYDNTVTLSFMDPPYNTGKTFATFNDSMGVGEWRELLRDSFAASKRTLKADGSIWVTMGGLNTLACWSLLNEVFGSECFVANIPWRRNYKATNSRSLSTVHDTILVYGREPKWCRRRGLPPRQTQTDKYRNPDGDPMGRWRLTHAGIKTYLNDLTDRGAMPVTWFDYPDYGHNEQATAETLAECGVSFSYAKPRKLLERILHIGTDSNDLVTDVFAGSGTTLSVAEEMNRRWIGIEKSERNIDEFIAPRLGNAIAEYWSE